jgi:hypothetical protein
MSATSNTTTTIENIGDGSSSGANVFQSGEKGAFFGSTPIVQPSITAVGTTTATTALNETKINRLYTALVNLGLINTAG